MQLKSEKEIEIMKKGGSILKEVLDLLLSHTKEGVSLIELDTIAEKKIRSMGAEPSFIKVPGYKWTCCFAVNDVVVHGIPTQYKLKESDIVGIDCGVYYKGFHTDTAWTISVKNSTKEIEKFLKVGEQALWNAIKEVKVGNRIGHISKALQQTIEGAGYSVVKSLTGHGVGRNLHEKPEIPGILTGSIDKTPRIVPGMVLAIEAIYTLGNPEIIYKADDGWTIATRDGKISGLFEDTVAVTNDGVFRLTRNCVKQFHPELVEGS